MTEIPKHLLARAERARATASMPGEPMFTQPLTPSDQIPEMDTALLEITSGMSPLSVVFDVVAYLRDGGSVVEMFDMIQRLKTACE